MKEESLRIEQEAAAAACRRFEIQQAEMALKTAEIEMQVQRLGLDRFK